MNASRLYPKIFQGREESGGFIAQNDKRKTAKSPHYRGRIHLAGLGWFWVSGWVRETKAGELISLSVTGLTDQEAEQYCKPVVKKKQAQAQRDIEQEEEETDPRDSGIPF